MISYHVIYARSGSTTTLKSDGAGGRRAVDDLESPGRAAAAAVTVHVDGGSVASEVQSDGSMTAAVGLAAHACRVAVLGAPKVGKTTLARQLLTSEYLANKDNYHGQQSFTYSPQNSRVFDSVAIKC